jgi:hypothetical protein
VSGNGTGALIGAAPASIAVDLAAPGGPVVLVGGAAGAILAVPTSGADAVTAWAALPDANAITTLLVDAPTRAVYAVQRAFGAVTTLSLDTATVDRTLAGPTASVGGLAIDLNSGQLFYASAASGTLTAAFPCDSATAGTGFLQPCAPTACAAGSASVSAGFCVSCPPGTSSATGASLCTPCALGTYVGVPNAAECLACPAGFSTSSVGATSDESCAACPAGTFAAAGAACAACPAGTFADAGAVACSLCGPGTASGGGAASCAWCPTTAAAYGYGAAACRPCADFGHAKGADTTVVASSVCGKSVYGPTTSASTIGTNRGTGSFKPLAFDSEGYVFIGSNHQLGFPNNIYRALLGSNLMHEDRNVQPLPGGVTNQGVVFGVISQAARTLIVGTKALTTAQFALLSAYSLTTSVVGFVPAGPSLALNASARESAVTSLLTDDVFVYASTNAHTIVKVRIDGLVRVATLNVTGVMEDVGAAVIDAAAGVAYYAAATGGAVAKVNLTSMSVIASATLPGFPANFAVTALLDATRGAVVLHLKLSPVLLIWFDMVSLAIIGNLTLPELNNALPMVFPPTGAVAADGTSLVAASSAYAQGYSNVFSAVSVNITGMFQSSAVITGHGATLTATSIVSAGILGVAGDAANGAVYVPNSNFLEAVQVVGRPVATLNSIAAHIVSVANSAAADVANKVSYVPFATSLMRVAVIRGVPRVTATFPGFTQWASSGNLGSADTMGACGLDAVAQMLFCGYSPMSSTRLATFAVNASSNANAALPPFVRKANVLLLASSSLHVTTVITDPARGSVYVGLHRPGSMSNDRLQRYNYTANGELVLNATIALASAGPLCGFIDNSGTFAYYGGYSSASANAGQVVRVALRTFTLTTLALSTSFGPVSGCTYDATNGLGYFSTAMSSGASQGVYVNTVNLATFARVGDPLKVPTVTGAAAVNGIKSASAGVSGGVFALACTDTSSASLIVYVNAPQPPANVSIASRQFIASAVAGLTPSAAGVTNLIPDWSTAGANYLATLALIDPAATHFTHSNVIVSVPAAPCAAGSVFSGGAGCTLCPAGTWSGVGFASCVACAPGRSSAAVGATSAGTCALCSAGFFSLGGAATCTECPASTWSGGGVGFCTPCGAGKVSPVGSSSSVSCANCAAGTYAPVLAGSCIACPAGSFSAGTVAACSACTGGYACPNAGTSTATRVSCLAGTFAPGGSTECAPCAAGTSTGGQLNQLSCSLCLSNYFSAAGAASCTVCPGGHTTLGLTGSASCTPCPVGTTANYFQRVQGTCTACPTGQTAPTPGSDCDWCAGTANRAGKYFINSTTPCEPCAAGTYLAAWGSGDPSAPTTFVSGDATIRCSICGAGYFCPVTGSSQRTGCPANTFCPVNAAGNSVALLCPGNSSSPGSNNGGGNPGSTACTPCTSGQVAPPGGSCRALVVTCPINQYLSEWLVCTPCPAGSYCRGGLRAPAIACVAGDVPPGWTLNASGVCAVCPIGSYCPGSVAAGGIDDLAVSCGSNSSTLTIASTRASDCLPVSPRGAYFNLTTATITNCTPGFISAGGVNVTACTKCAANSRTLSEPRTSCTACPQGFIVVNGTACEACLPNTYQDGGECKACPPGSSGAYWVQDFINRGQPYQPPYINLVQAPQFYVCMSCAIAGGGLTNLYPGGPCDTCPDGWYGRSAGSGYPTTSLNSPGVACTKCPLGTYMHPNRQSCLSCGANFLSPQPADGAVVCIGCGLGTYLAASSPANCTPCAAGTFTSRPATDGVTQCTACPAGSVSPPGAIACSACPAGTYASANGVAPCSACGAVAPFARSPA